jgi:hypothetical protein
MDSKYAYDKMIGDRMRQTYLRMFDFEKQQLHKNMILEANVNDRHSIPVGPLEKYTPLSYGEGPVINGLVNSGLTGAGASIPIYGGSIVSPMLDDPQYFIGGSKLANIDNGVLHSSNTSTERGDTITPSGINNSRQSYGQYQPADPRLPNYRNQGSSMASLAGPLTLSGQLDVGETWMTDDLTGIAGVPLQRASIIPSLYNSSFMPMMLLDTTMPIIRPDGSEITNQPVPTNEIPEDEPLPQKDETLEGSGKTTGDENAALDQNKLYTNFIAGAKDTADAYKQGVRNYRKQIQKDIEDTTNEIQKLQTKMESEMLKSDAGKDTKHDHAGILKQIEELNEELQDLNDLKEKTFDPDFQPTGEPRTKN